MPENLAKTPKIRWPEYVYSKNKMAGIHVYQKIISQRSNGFDNHSELLSFNSLLHIYLSSVQFQGGALVHLGTFNSSPKASLNAIFSLSKLYKFGKQRQ